MKKLKFIQYGCGKMSIYTMKFAIDNGHELVGAVDINNEIIGKDVSILLGGENLGIEINSIDKIEQIISETKPDICILTTMSLLNDCKDALITCAKNGVNVITTCEEAFFPHNSHPTLTKEIDELAKQNNCTITGSGYQDAFWGNLVSTIAGSTHDIKEIKGSSSYNVEDYGIALAQAHGAGLTKEEFDCDIASSDNITKEERKELINNGEFLPSYMWNVNGWLCDKLGLKVIDQTQKCIPTFHSEDINSQTLNMTVKEGMATGMRAIVTTHTEEGITLECECVGKVYSADDFDSNRWEVIGNPNTKMVIDKPNTVELTCAAVVNRLNTVVDANPGFIPTSQMGEMTYQKN